MIDWLLLFAEVLFKIVALLALAFLCTLVVRRHRRRDKIAYVRKRQAEGTDLIFSPDPKEVSAGLQLLVRFGINAPAPFVLARLAELSGSDERNTAVLSRRVLRDCATEVSPQKPDRLISSRKMRA